MKSVLFALLYRRWTCALCLVGLLVLLSACGDVTQGGPATWKNYQGSGFRMSYLSSWDVATKDVYLGTSYPQLEMLPGMAFTNTASPATFVQVAYAQDKTGKASLSSLLRAFMQDSLKPSGAVAPVSVKTLASEHWSQIAVEKQVKVSYETGSSTVTVKETALGIKRSIGPQSTEIYLIIYQDATSTYNQTNQRFFTRMLNSFHFVE